jgi:hypothetical protein
MNSTAEFICRQSAEPELVITVLRLHGVPWDEGLCVFAALMSKLQLLQWLRSSSCPWHAVQRQQRWQRVYVTVAGKCHKAMVREH